MHRKDSLPVSNTAGFNFNDLSNIISIVIIENNDYAKLLCGEQDSNLVYLANACDIEIEHKGNNIFLKGEDEKRYKAINILERLYIAISSNLSISSEDIEGIISIASENNSSYNVSSSDNELNNKAKEHINEDSQESSAKTTVKSNKLAVIETRKKRLVARSERQVQYIQALEKYDLVFGIGPAGTGKTYLAVAHAAMLLETGKVEKIILSRPAVEAGERLGFLPGDMKEKVDPYLRPLYDALYDMLPAEKIENFLAAGKIEIAPLAFMRGRTLRHAAIILDEAQNTSLVQMRMFLSRLGEGSCMIITGDPSQIDLPTPRHSGLLEAVEVLNNIDKIKIITFKEQDVIRHALVGTIVKAYNKHYEKKS